MRKRERAAFSLPDCRKSCTDSVVEEYNRRSRVPCLPSCPAKSVCQFSSVQFSVFSLQLSVARAVAGQVFCSAFCCSAAEKRTAVVYIFVASTTLALALSHFTLSACALVFCFSVHFLSLFLSSLPSFLYQHLLLLFFFCC